MNRIYGIARYTFQEHWRHRVYLSSLLFGAVLLIGGLVVSSLAVDARLRMMNDLGLAALECIALISIVFTSVNLVLSEIESRTLYLLLSHPLPRWQYLLGRFLGTLVAVGTGLLLMAILHIAILKMLGWEWTPFYAISIFCALLKLMVIGALALFLSLFSTSAPTAMTFTIFLWVAGHFSSEMNYLSQQSANPLIKALIKGLYFISPNFNYFNFRDFMDAAQTPPAAWLAWLVFYALSYTLACLLLANRLFAKKEF